MAGRAAGDVPEKSWFTVELTVTVRVRAEGFSEAADLAGQVVRTISTAGGEATLVSDRVTAVKPI